MNERALTLAALGVSVIGAALYGFVFLRRDPSLLRTLVKSLAVGSLALLAAFHGPWLLAVGLAFSTLGDAFLAGKPERWLPFGLASFLVAQVTYAVVFWMTAGGPGVVEPSRLAAMGVVAAGALGMLAWLWPKLGPLRLAVIAYVAAIVAMVETSLMLRASWATLGALLFFGSDAVLSAQLFRQRCQTVLGEQAVWWLYFAGQFAIAAAFRPI